MVQFVALLCALIALQTPGTLAVADSLETTSSEDEGYCFSVLTPLKNHIARHQDQWNATEVIKANDILSKQERIESLQKKIESQVIHLQGNQSLLDSQQMASRNSQQNLEVRQNDLEKQLAALHELVSSHEYRIKYWKFQQLASRLFYIEEDVEQSWWAAGNTCRNMGGHLAGIKDYHELYRITQPLKRNTWYWIGINDKASKGQYISSATGKVVSYLRWGDGYPYDYSSYNCVYLYNEVMYNYKCDYSCRFICQADDTI